MQAARYYARNFLPMSIPLLPRTRSFFARRITYAPGVIAQCDCIYRPGSPECSGADVFLGGHLGQGIPNNLLAGDLGVSHNTDSARRGNFRAHLS